MAKQKIRQEKHLLPDRFSTESALHMVITPCMSKCGKGFSSASHFPGKRVKRSKLVFKVEELMIKLRIEF